MYYICIIYVLYTHICIYVYYMILYVYYIDVRSTAADPEGSDPERFVNIVVRWIVANCIFYWNMFDAAPRLLAYRCNVVSVKRKKLCYKQIKKAKKIYGKITPKWYRILEKSASDTLLERFGHPPSAKMPQERHQDQNLMKNVQFLGALWGPKWSQNPRKICIEIAMLLVPM